MNELRRLVNSLNGAGLIVIYLVVGGALLVLDGVWSGLLMYASWESAGQAVAMLKDLVLGAAAVVGAVVAIRGLNTWNRQLRGGAEYELARRVGRAVLRLRDALKGVRHPIMMADEQPYPPEKEAERMTQDQKRFYGLSGAYQKRYDKVQSARAELEAELQETEVLWGGELRELCQPLFTLERELFVDVYTYVMICNPDTHAESKQVQEELRRKRREVLYDTALFGDPDPFADDVAACVSAIQQHLARHLPRPQ